MEMPPGSGPPSAQYVHIEGIPTPASRIGLGTWSIGGWMWGGSDELAVRTLERALDVGVNFWDTAPVYGFGRAEELVGMALRRIPDRSKVLISTKLGLDWSTRTLRRDASRQRIRQEIHDSLRRLGTDYIDLIQVHWPDSRTPAYETVSTLQALQQEGLVLACGVGNYSVPQMDAYRQYGHLASNQVAYNLLERGAEQGVLPYCLRHDVLMIAYGALCRGLLSGCKTPRSDNFTGLIERLDKLAQQKYDRRVLHLGVRWLLEKTRRGIVLWSARRPEQLDAIADIVNWQLEPADMEHIARIVENWPRHANPSVRRLSQSG